jgi:hypothetical protein
MSVAERLKDAIERYAVELFERSALVETARRGELTERAMALYLESLRYLFQHSERNLHVAALRCEELGRGRLAAWFWHKRKQEDGHDRWAMNDLATLPPAAVAGIRPTAAAVSLVELQAQLIEQDPLCFVAYVQWAEHFSAHVGDDWLNALASSGFPRTQVSAIDKHLAVDHEHAAAGFREIEGLLTDSIDVSLLLAAVDRAGRIFEALCNEICAEAHRAA